MQIEHIAIFNFALNEILWYEINWYWVCTFLSNNRQPAIMEWNGFLRYIYEKIFLMSHYVVLIDIEYALGTLI